MNYLLNESLLSQVAHEILSPRYNQKNALVELEYWSGLASPFLHHTDSLLLCFLPITCFVSQRYSAI